MSIEIKQIEGLENVKMTKEEIRAFYNKLEENDEPYFDLLPFPDFMVRENPLKYGGLREDEFKNIENGIEYLKLKEEGKEEEAEKLRKSFLKSLPKPQKPAINSRFQFTKPQLTINANSANKQDL